MHPTGPQQDNDIEATARRNADDALLAELSAPPPLDEAQESLQFWRHRLAELPVYKHAERREAREMVARWEQRVGDAKRAAYGPSPLDQLLDAIGISWRPNRRRLVMGFSAALILMVVLIVLLVVAAIVLWPELSPIINQLLNSGGEGSG
jgi:hypothetical protein